MHVKAPLNLLVVLILAFIIFSILGCAALAPQPTPTPTATSTSTTIPTKTPIPTATATETPKPSPTPTIPPVPTISIDTQSAINMQADCRQAIDGFHNLKNGLGLPDHFMSENPLRQAADFDPNQYFNVLTHLKLASGYKLDYVYFNDELGGLPLVYARKSSSAPYKSYSELLKSYGEDVTGERSYGELLHKYDYLEKVKIDKTPESYLEFVTLAFLGDQFYLWWHGLYNDAVILCDSSDQQYVDAELNDFEIEFPQDVIDRIDKIDFTPIVIVDESTVTVHFVTFTKWGGFFENIYVMDKGDPMQLLDVEFNPVVEYDCGIAF